MVRALFGVEALLADEADAIALAVCHVSRGPHRAPPPRAPAPRSRRTRGVA
jgi:Holliday junction resolvasome RuvABC endonuclease subunit